jgi:hypothetical protein
MRTVVMLIDLVLGIVAVAGGAYLAVRSRSLAGRWLPGLSPRAVLAFGLALLVVAGGSLFAAAGLLTADIRIGRLVSIEAGIVLVGWGALLFSTAGRRHWTQAAAMVLGVAVVLLSFALPVPG